MESITAEPLDFSYKFSICSVITSTSEYGLMKKSFEERGFISDCEYLIADNSGGNVFDAYEATRIFMRRAKGRFIILVHQDVRCIDSRIQLEANLDALGKVDPKWALCGNAGAASYHEYLLHINNNGTITTHTNLPAPVYSLDENFIIIDNNKSLAISSDIRGFHLYGTDLCLIADMLGYSSYVIPFMVKHLSLGNLRDLSQFEPAFIKAYGRKFRRRYVQTTCTKFYLAGSAGTNRFMNSAPVFFLIKNWYRLRFLLFKRWPHKRTKTQE